MLFVLQTDARRRKLMAYRQVVMIVLTMIQAVQLRLLDDLISITIGAVTVTDTDTDTNNIVLICSPSFTSTYNNPVKYICLSV